MDTLVFTGGIRENAPLVRARICEGLEFFGIKLGQARNASRITVRVIRTDEELMIVRSVGRLLRLAS